jgi:hypothetical protein
MNYFAIKEKIPKEIIINSKYKIPAREYLEILGAESTEHGKVLLSKTYLDKITKELDRIIYENSLPKKTYKHAYNKKIAAEDMLDILQQYCY